MDGETTLSVIIPAYNEEDTIPILHKRLDPVLQRSWGKPYEIIFIDDGSTDRTWTLIDSLASAHPAVRGIKFSRNFGQHAAISAGLESARGDLIIIMDSDLQDPPEAIPRYIATMRNTACEIVFGIRKKHAESKLRELFSNAYAFIFNACSQYKITPNVATLCLLSRKVVDALNRCNDTRKFYAGLLAWTGFPISYVELEPNERIAGRSKYNLFRLFIHAFNGIFSFSIFPLRIATLLGVTFSLIGFLLGLFFFFFKLFNPDVPTGFTSIFVLITFMGGTILLSLGVIGDYIGRIFEAINNRPRFVIDRIVQKDLP